MAKILDDFYGKNLFRGGTIASNHDFFLSRVLTCLLCRKRAEMSSQSYFEKSILTNMIIVLESVKPIQNIHFLYLKSEIVNNFDIKFLFSSIFLTFFPKLP